MNPESAIVAESRSPGDHDDGTPQLLALSARSPEALQDLVAAYAAMLDKPESPALEKVCRATARQREHHRLRTFVVADNATQAAQRLRRLDPAPRHAARNKAAFVYTGMGPQWWGMGAELLRVEPRFAEVVAACDEVLARYDLSIAEELLRGEAESRLTRAPYAQVANFVVQVGLTALLRDWGIEPTVVVGLSAGGVSAAYAAGVYSLEDALAVSFHCARLHAQLAGRGVMAMVDVPVDTLQTHLGDTLSVAAVNSAATTVLAGDPDAMTAVAVKLRASGASVRVLPVDVAYHSYQMDWIREPLLAALRDIRPRSAKIALFSTVTGDRVYGAELDAEYWWRSLRQTVQFAGAMRQTLTSEPEVILEIGPHPVMTSAIDEALAEHGSEAVQFASLRRDRPQRHQLLETLGGLYTAGVEPDWERVFPGPHEHLDLPSCP